MRDVEIFVLCLVLLLFSFSFGFYYCNYIIKVEVEEAEEVEEVSAYQIFTHNLQFLLVFLIPVIGNLYAIYQATLAGAVLGAKAIALNIPLKTAYLTVMTHPHIYLELSSYALANTAGITLILERDINKYAIYAVTSVILLIIAAITEAIPI